VEVVDWINMDQDSYQCWALVSRVMKFQVPHNTGNLLSSCEERLCCMQ
jgi:hypothetical protein